MKIVLLWLPSFFWMFVIFYFSSQTTNQIEIIGPSRFLFFKSLHLVEYAILFLTYLWATKSKKISFLLLLIFAASDEYHQSFIVTRSPRLTDTIIDFLGGNLGNLFYSIRSLAPKSKLR